MRKLVVSEYVTLDGVFQDPGGAEKSEIGGWSHPFWSQQAGKFKYDELFARDAMLLGRVTYEGFAAAWPKMEGTGDFGERMNSIAKYVVSTTLDHAEWNNSKIISSNVADEIAKLKKQPGQDILVAGSAKLLQTLMQNNLVDEYRVLVHPIVLGKGRRLFQDAPTVPKLKLVSSQPFDTGIVLLTYQPDAPTK